MTPDAKIPVNKLEIIVNMPFVSMDSYMRERMGMEERAMEDERNCR
jgi:hypothetical protein